MGINSVAILGNNVLSYKTEMKGSMGNVAFQNNSADRFLNEGSNDAKSLAGAHYQMASVISQDAIKTSENYMSDINDTIRTFMDQFSKETAEEFDKATELNQKANNNPLSAKECTELGNQRVKDQQKYYQDYNQVETLKFEKTALQKFSFQVSDNLYKQKLKAEDQQMLTNTPSNAMNNPFSSKQALPA